MEWNNNTLCHVAMCSERWGCSKEGGLPQTRELGTGTHTRGRGRLLYYFSSLRSHSRWRREFIVVVAAAAAAVSEMQL